MIFELTIWSLDHSAATNHWTGYFKYPLWLVDWLCDLYQSRLIDSLAHWSIPWPVRQSIRSRNTRTFSNKLQSIIQCPSHKINRSLIPNIIPNIYCVKRPQNTHINTGSNYWRKFDFVCQLDGCRRRRFHVRERTGVMACTKGCWTCAIK